MPSKTSAKMKTTYRHHHANFCVTNLHSDTFYAGLNPSTENQLVNLIDQR